MKALLLCACLGCASTDGFRSVEWTPPFEASGLQWRARTGGPTGAGNNRWSARPPNLEIGGQRMVLRVDERSAEVSTVLPDPPYEVEVELEGRLDTLDPSVVLGVFLYRNDQSEVDFEVSRWGDPDASDGQFVVAPARPDRMWRFALDDSNRTIVRFRWAPPRLVVELVQQRERRRWVRRVDLDRGRHRLHINLWRRTPGSGSASIAIRRAAIRD